MSEYQVIAFRAIDGPVSPKDLEFMRRQSTRAEVTPWSFDNEYHYSDFRGDVAGMLQRGYDFHLRYANFGVRTLMSRLPNGLPDAAAVRPYFEEDAFYFSKDKQGPGGILRIGPCFEPGQLNDLLDLKALIQRLLPLRAEILNGDLRPFYLARLGIAGDMNHDPAEEKEGPVPAGLNSPTDAQRALAELYGLDSSMIAAAAQKSPPLPEAGDEKERYTAWLAGQPEQVKTAWLAQLMADPGAAVRREILTTFQKSQGTPSWPTAPGGRTIAELETLAEGIRQRKAHRDAANAERRRAQRLTEMAEDPTDTLRETERLVEQRSVAGYHQAAALLADLREALSGTDRAGLAGQQARKLRIANPTLNRLTKALREQGFL